MTLSRPTATTRAKTTSAPNGLDLIVEQNSGLLLTVRLKLAQDLSVNLFL
jgi:hypothetical protein